MKRLQSTQRSSGLSRLCVATAALWLGCSILLAPVSAAIFTATIDPTLYGNLDQDNVPFMGGCACGPTSVTNSLVYLQKEKPNIYGPNGKGLVPYVGAAPTQAEQAAAATILQDNNHMAQAGGGVYIEDFIYGKVQYLEERFPGRTRYAAQVGLDWRSGPQPMGVTDWPRQAAINPKPAWVQNNTSPTLDFLYKQIRDREDVEIFIGGGVGGHFLTVTGISYNDANNTGTLNYIDPADGLAHNTPILGLDMGIIKFTYGGSNNALIFHAVSESPVPEPAAIALILIGLFGLGAFRRRASFRVVLHN